MHTIPGHPELIWPTFEYANRTTGVTDVASSALGLPAQTPLNDLTGLDTSNINHILYRPNTLPSAWNIGPFIPTLNAATQMFTTPATNIYRVFPAGKSTDPATRSDVVGNAGSDSNPETSHRG